MQVAVIGGGAIGGAIACFLAEHPRFAGSITVIERDPSYARASSALAASAIRQQFSTPINAEMSLFGIGFLRDAARTLAVDGDVPALGLHEQGYLFLATDAGLPVLRDNVALQCGLGADIALLPPASLRDRFPWLATADLAGGSLGLSGEGWFDGYVLLQAFKRRARAAGVRYLTAEAIACDMRGDRVLSVRLDDGTHLACDVLVNAAGPWAARVAAMLGIDLPVRARRRMVFVFDCRTPLLACPLVIDPTGIWFRPEQGRFIAGRSPWAGEPDPDEPPLEVDEAMFTDTIWPVLAARVPAFEAIRLTSAWAGYYEMNVFDHNGIVGPHPAVANAIFANGFSGHGLQHAPAIGRAVAELIADGRFCTLDLSVLGWPRVLRGEKLLERNVV